MFPGSVSISLTRGDVVWFECESPAGPGDAFPIEQVDGSVICHSIPVEPQTQEQVIVEYDIDKLRSSSDQVGLSAGDDTIKVACDHKSIRESEALLIEEFAPTLGERPDMDAALEFLDRNEQLWKGIHGLYHSAGQVCGPRYLEMRKRAIWQIDNIRTMRRDLLAEQESVRSLDTPRSSASGNSTGTDLATWSNILLSFANTYAISRANQRAAERAQNVQRPSTSNRRPRVETERPAYSGAYRSCEVTTAEGGPCRW